MEIPTMPQVFGPALSKEVWEAVNCARDREVQEIKGRLDKLDTKFNTILVLLIANLAGLVVAIFQGGGLFK